MKRFFFHLLLSVAVLTPTAARAQLQMDLLAMAERIEDVAGVEVAYADLDRADEAAAAFAEAAPATAAATAAAAPVAAAEIAAPILGDLDANLAAKLQFTKKAVSKFSKMPAAVWPTAREYVWLRVFAPWAIFDGYGEFSPGNETTGTMNFTVMISRMHWDELTSEDRQMFIEIAKEQFAAAMQEIGVPGKLEILLTSR